MISLHIVEREIRKKYRYSNLSYVFDVYMECEYRANLTKGEYDGLLPGEFRFDYESWERRLGISKKQLVRAIKELTINNAVIVQTFKGRRGISSKYFLTRFEEQKKEQNEELKRNLKGTEISLENTEFEGNEGTEKGTQKEQNEEQKKVHSSRYNNLDIISNNTISKDIVCSTKVQPIVEKWNSLNIQKIVCVKEGTNRYKLLNARIKEYGIDNVLKAIDNINYSSFLRGQSKSNWIITFDWLIRPNNFIKVLEGNYSDKEGQALNNSISKEVEEWLNE
ncbi:MAG: helix-turn-helix domain-containing protein [Clostridium sp.]|uniref:helix-turn-helix domain-containing protein n=1 Tax=Clostridium paraputrificum TaxID=29363 RepID=UPI0011BEA746|nr:helix-turn-helix domain-containing protein [Clostridium paraputrificum]MDU1075799.1 helix-turn-helix domain-containing protein [Clostridium sp.]MDU1095991.1 helix-turn-helix domain-containing protein [Clostridioides difficile]MDU1124077.1 helix-turn-helix domain-containing protein [Clostridium sp.]